MYMTTEREVEPEVITVGEAAAKLRCTDDTIRKYVDNGTLSGTRVGGKILISRRSLDAIIERVHAPSEGRANTRVPVVHTASMSSAPYRPSKAR